MNKTYVEMVRLLLDVAPDVFQARSFAMKGGKALDVWLCDLRVLFRVLALKSESWA